MDKPDKRESDTEGGVAADSESPFDGTIDLTSDPAESATPAGSSSPQAAVALVSQDGVLLRLTAIATTLNSERRQQRLDVVGDAIEGVLHAKGALSVEEIGNQVNKTWGTQSMTPALIQRALDRATHARLIIKEETFEGDIRYRLTEDSRRQLDSDRQWAERVLADFAQEFSRRLVSACETKIKPKRIPKLQAHLLQALIEGTSGKESAVFDLDPGRVSARFNVAAIAEYIRRNVEPKQVAEAVKLVALQAADYHDDFGNEVVHLLMTGALLHTALTNKDIETDIPLSGMRLALDTSTLIYAIDPDPKTRALFDRLVIDSCEAGVEVNVAEHTIAEWERVWEAANAEIGGALKRGELDALSKNPDIVGNVVVRAFLYAYESDPKLTWRRFELDHKGIGPRLEKLGVNVRPAGNNRQEDIELAERIEDRLNKWASRNPRFGRTAFAAHDDAATCAMVARWRRNNPGDPATAWFVGSDTYTGRAYKQVRPADRYRLHITPQAWMLYLATVRQDTADVSADDMSQIASVITRSEVMSMASTYPVEEAAVISRVLGTDNGHIPPDELREITQLDFERLVDDAMETLDSKAVLENVLRKREKRRQQSAQRALEMAESREQAAESREQAAARKEQELAQVRLESLAKVDKARAATEAAEAETNAERRRYAELLAENRRQNLKLRRSKYLIASIFVAALYGGIWVAAPQLAPVQLWFIGALLLGALFVHMYRWVKKEAPISDLVREAAVGGFVTAALFLIEELRN